LSELIVSANPAVPGEFFKTLKMKKFSFSLLMLFGFLAFSTALQAQSATNKNCQQPCTKSAQTAATQLYSPLFVVAANEEKASSPSTASANEKANSKKECKRTVAVNGKCDPNSEECLPPNCIIVPCKSQSTAVAVNQKPGS
jgi:hypothetical protein